MDFFALSGWFIGLLSAAFSVWAYRRQQRQVLHRQERFEWTHVQQGVRQVCRLLQKRGFHPEALIAVPGAGVLLSELAIIEINEWLPIVMIYQKKKSDASPFPFSGGVEVTTSKWRYYLSSDVLALKECRVLIFDDYAQSGDTLITLRDAMLNHGFARRAICSASLLNNRALRESGKVPDIAWFWVDTFDVHMPWGGVA